MIYYFNTIEWDRVNFVKANGLQEFITTEEFNKWQIENRNEFVKDQLVGFWNGQDYFDWLHKFRNCGQGFFILYHGNIRIICQQVDIENTMMIVQGNSASITTADTYQHFLNYY